MNLLKEFDGRDLAEAGRELHGFAADLYPICRSITGDGIRQTLECVGRRIPLRMSEVPTGTPVFDWTVPKEWNIRDAFIKSPDGRRVVDFRRSNLHVMSYSTPVHATMPLRELKSHLFTLPDHPAGFPIEPPTIRRTGDSVWRTIRCWPLKTATTRSALTQHWRMVI